MIEMEAPPPLNPSSGAVRSDPWPGQELKDANINDSTYPSSDSVRGDPRPGMELKGNKKDSLQDMVPMTSLVPGSEVTAGTEVAGMENGVTGGDGGGGVMVLTAC